MNTTRRIAFAVSFVAVAAAATPSFAQTRAQRMVQPQYQDTLSGQTWGELATPGLRNPYECWSDEGNGRFSNCNNAGS